MLVLVANETYIDTDDLDQEDYAEWCRIREEEERSAPKYAQPTHIKSNRFLQQHRHVYGMYW